MLSVRKNFILLVFSSYFSGCGSQPDRSLVSDELAPIFSEMHSTYERLAGDPRVLEQIGGMPTLGFQQAAISGNLRDHSKIGGISFHLEIMSPASIVDTVKLFSGRYRTLKDYWSDISFKSSEKITTTQLKYGLKLLASPLESGSFSKANAIAIQRVYLVAQVALIELSSSPRVSDTNSVLGLESGLTLDDPAPTFPQITDCFDRCIPQNGSFVQTETTDLGHATYVKTVNNAPYGSYTPEFSANSKSAPVSQFKYLSDMAIHKALQSEVESKGTSNWKSQAQGTGSLATTTIVTDDCDNSIERYTYNSGGQRYICRNHQTGVVRGFYSSGPAHVEEFVSVIPKDQPTAASALR